MQSSNIKTFKTFKAKVYDHSLEGKMLVGTVLVTIDQSDIDLTKHSDRVTLEELTEVKDVSSLDTFDFPLFEYEDIEVSEAEQFVMQSTVDETNNHLHNVCTPDIDLDNTDIMSEFEAIPEDDEGLDFENFQEDALLEDVDAYENEFFPINHPFHIAGVKVNRRGNVILDVDEETMKTSRICLMDRNEPNKNNRISRENKYKNGPVVGFEIYRNHAWLKAGDFHLATEIVKTFNPHLVLYEIKVNHLDGNCENCRLDNLDAIIDPEQPNPIILSAFSSTSAWTLNKFWDGQVIPNSISSIDGKIASINDFGAITLKSISSKVACYSVNICGMKFDARKLIWRTFTNTNPCYSSERYKIRVIDENRSDHLSYDNLEMTLVSSIFQQWSTENEKWPWTRSKKGLLPREKKERKARNSVSGKSSSKSAQMKKQVKTYSSAKKTATPAKTVVKKNTRRMKEQVETPSSAKKTAAPAKALVKKNIRRMSENKFQRLKKLVEMNLTISPKEREIFLEQKTLRRLKAFLG